LADRPGFDWSPTTTRHVIEEGGSMGGGLQIVAVDIDGDGDLDIVASGKTGLYLAENLKVARGL
jgi:hypothetical protein